MADLRTEEEQVEAIKNWWKENGRTTILGIVLAITAVTSWQYWKNFKQTNAEQSSVMYQNFISAASVQQGQPLSDENRKTAVHLAEQLKTDYSSSTYSQYATLWLAKSMVEQGDYAAARKHLAWVLEQEPELSIKAVAQLRMARIFLQEGAHDQALSYVNVDIPEGFVSEYSEVKGDILAAKGDEEGAFTAYQAALSSVKSAQLHPILEMKRDNYAAEGQ